jgi:hypothetical protein
VNPDSVSVFSFPDRILLPSVAQRAAAICTNGRRTYILGVRREVLILYYHSDLKVDAQFVVKVDNPLGIVAANDVLYIVCQQVIAPFDKAGKPLEVIPLTSRLRFYESAANSVYFVFTRVIWCIGKDQKILKISVDNTVQGFAAVDDARCAALVGGRILLSDHGGAKINFSPLVKCEKKVSALKAYGSKLAGPVDSLFALFDDGTATTWPLPASKDRT